MKAAVFIPGYAFFSFSLRTLLSVSLTAGVSQVQVPVEPDKGIKQGWKSKTIENIHFRHGLSNVSHIFLFDRMCGCCFPIKDQLWICVIYKSVNKMYLNKNKGCPDNDPCTEFDLLRNCPTRTLLTVVLY